MSKRYRDEEMSEYDEMRGAQIHKKEERRAKKERYDIPPMIKKEKPKQKFVRKYDEDED